MYSSFLAGFQHPFSVSHRSSRHCNIYFINCHTISNLRDISAISFYWDTIYIFPYFCPIIIYNTDWFRFRFIATFQFFNQKCSCLPSTNNHDALPAWISFSGVHMTETCLYRPITYTTPSNKNSHKYKP